MFTFSNTSVESSSTARGLPHVLQRCATDEVGARCLRAAAEAAATMTQASQATVLVQA
jgi:hypothetical protein